MITLFLITIAIAAIADWWNNRKKPPPDDGEPLGI